MAAAKLVQAGGLTGKAKAALAELLQGFARWREGLAKEGHVVVAATLLDESGYTEMWKLDKTPEGPGRLENLKEFIRALGEFESLAGFLEHVALVAENDENAEGQRLSLMTLHAAKGLEFDVVFLPGWEEGLFPHARAMEEGGDRGVEEERRLAYVGLTRARKLAIVSCAANRRIYGNWTSSIPSRFLDELPLDQVQREGSAGMQRNRMVDMPSVFTGAGGLQARKPRVIEAAWEVQARPAPVDAIAVGQRIFHQKFGYGRVTGVDDDKLDIDFEKSGAKRVLDRFVEKA
jgi:DNA helicase-2/ATP-dependent DNA helicase PcrA